MRQRMMAVGDVQLAIRARGAFVGDQERNHAGQIGLESDGQHVGHQFEVLGEIRGNAIGLIHVRIDLGVVFLGPLDASFDFANRRKILIELAAVGRTQAAFEVLCILGDEIENAAPVAGPSGALLGSQRCSIAEQALEERARIEHWRQRLRLALPCQVVGVGAGVSRIAITGLTRVLDSDFE